MEPSPALRKHPSKLIVETTTSCNLRCRMCVKETWDKRAMEAKANSSNVFLNAENLVARDTDFTNKLEQLFSQLQTIAGRHGMELRLPGVVPLSNRKCDFVEEGCAFVTCKGDVHPCYFLWHEYSCHFPGRKKKVTPRTFGNLRDAGILEIWNSTAFLAFREDVLRYDYPYCSNCDVAPCEFVETEQFEQDCYRNTIPCGDCYWGMGLFNCLR